MEVETNMTPQEFDVIRAAIKSAYPTFNIMPDRYSIQLWYRMLGDIDFKICETALQELIATQTYPPQIAEIRAKCADYTSPQIKDSGEAGVMYNVQSRNTDITGQTRRWKACLVRQGKL